MKQIDRPIEILLIEDDGASARLTERAIKHSKAGGRVSVVEDGSSALKYLKRVGRYKGVGRPSLILLDISLGEMTGWEVLSCIKDDPSLKEIPVVVLTASQDEYYVQHCYEMGADGLINKPMSTEKYEEMLETQEDFMLSIQPQPYCELPPDIWY
ncbi:MAG: response regulator [Sedimentisphaerales bacterium]|nr:response regulator [Sedimentisphaerales bacterium]